MIIEEITDTGIAEPCPAGGLEGFFTPPDPRLVGSSGRLGDAVTSRVVWGDASATLANAAVLKLVERGRMILAGTDGPFAALLANAVADLSVSGTAGFGHFRNMALTGSIGQVRERVLGEMAAARSRLGVQGVASAGEKRAAVRAVVDRALAVVWALHGPAEHRAARRAELGWIAASAEHDRPMRPVNVPATAWPTRDLGVTIRHHGRETQCRIRYAIAGARDFCTSSTDTFPDLGHVPVIGREDDIVVFVHGHSSRLEEVGSLYAALAEERASCSPHRLVLVAFDLPTNGYSQYIDPEAISPMHETRFVPDHPEDRRFGMLEFLETCVVAFVEALDVQMRWAGHAGILDRISAVIGGSLGGNLCLRLAERLVTHPSWLRTVVAWSPGSAPPSLGRKDYLIPSPGEHVDPIGKQALDRTRDRCDDAEGPGSRTEFFRINLSGERLINDGTPGFEAGARFLGHLVGSLAGALVPLGPFAVFGSSIVVEGVANTAVFSQSSQWLRPECRAGSDSAARATAALLSMAEVYSSERRRMHWRVAFEQLLFSHQDQIAVSRGRACFELCAVPLLLVAGANDNTNRWEIYNSVRAFAPRMTRNRGRVLFVQNTGHSIHDERPRWLARRIQQFLCEHRARVPVRDLLLVAPQIEGTAANDFWVMKYHGPARRWGHVSPILGHGFGADLNCDQGLPLPTAFGVKFAVTGDFDGDGQQEVAVAPERPGTAGNDLWVMRFDSASSQWTHLSPDPSHPFGADLNCDGGLSTPTTFGVKFAVTGDFDGDGKDELAVAPDAAGTGGNDFWVMKYDRRSRRWGHLSPIPGHAFGADLNCDAGVSRPAGFGVKHALVGDFDGDGQDELVVSPDLPGTGGNDFWVMKFDRVSRKWTHLSPDPSHPFGADLNCDLGLASPTAFGVKFAVVGDFDGDGQEELAVAPGVPGTAGNDFWVMKFDRDTRRWGHLSPDPSHPFGADLNCDLGLASPTAFGVRFAVAGDFDGDGQEELAVAPDAPGTAGNDFWVMKFDRDARRWGHLSPDPSHPFGADLNCDLGLASPTAFGVRFAVAGDFDGDGQEELAVAPDAAGTAGNDFWVMKFDRAARRWGHLSPDPSHPFGADLNCDLGLASPTAFGVRFALPLQLRR